jgi:hypothetical protein
MVFPIVALPDPPGTMIWTNLNYIISESFQVKMGYSGSVVLEEIFKSPHQIFVFFYYLPFEEDLALYLYNLESPLPKVDLYQVWLNLAC